MKEKLLLGYMINSNNMQQFSEKMFDSSEIKSYLQTVNKPADKVPEKVQLKNKQIANDAVINFNIYLQQQQEEGNSADDVIKKLIDEFENSYYQRIGFFDMVYDDFFDPRLTKKIQDEYITTGFSQMDFYLNGGLKKKTFTGIQATTGGGKTTMLMSIGVNIMKKGYNVAFVNLEMNEQEFNNNIVSGLMYNDDFYSAFTHDKIQNKFNVENPEYLNSVRDLISTMKIGKHTMIVNNSYNKINSKSLEELLLLQEKRLGIKFDVILIDYLFLLDTYTKGIKNEQSYENLQRLSQESHKMSQRNDWAVLSVFQTNRTGYNTDKATTLSMAGSFNALHDMDNYFVFRREEDTDFIIVTPDKLRQYNGVVPKEDFRLKYNRDYKIYVENSSCKKEVRDYKWQDIYMLDIVHNNLNVQDFNNLLESYDKKGVSKGMISSFEKQNNISHPKKSLIDWHDLDIESAINKISSQNVVTKNIGFSAEDLFSLT